MASKLEVIGGDGSTFNWLSPQNGMELRHPVKLLALAMRDKLPSTAPPDDFYDNIQSVYEMIWHFRQNTRISFTWYIRKDLAIGDDLSDFDTATRYDWDSLGLAIGEDLTFFKDMTFDDISYIQTGTIFPKNLLTIMYKIVGEISLYRANFGALPMDSYDEQWVYYLYDDGFGDDSFTHFSSRIEGVAFENQNDSYNNILSYINNNGNYGEFNSFNINGVTEVLIPRRIGAFYRGSSQQIGNKPLRYWFDLFGTQFQQNYPSLAKSFNFGYPLTRSDGFQDLYSAGEFKNIFPDATTEYYQYVYSKKNGTGYTATDYSDFGGGFLENKISHIQQAYSADGYILRTDPLTMDFSSVPNEVPASYGCSINAILAFNINESRFTDYYTTP